MAHPEGDPTARRLLEIRPFLAEKLAQNGAHDRGLFRGRLAGKRCGLGIRRRRGAGHSRQHLRRGQSRKQEFWFCDKTCQRPDPGRPKFQLDIVLRRRSFEAPCPRADYNFGPDWLAALALSCCCFAAWASIRACRVTSAPAQPSLYFSACMVKSFNRPSLSWV